MWHLEDIEASIPLDLTQTNKYNVLFTEGSQVIVQGYLVDGVFRVEVSMS